MSLIWNSAGDTHAGKCRSNNQDTVLERGEDGLWMVADGMGGHHAGELASQSIAAGLRNLQLCDQLSDCVDQVDDALIRINHDLRIEARHRGQGAIGSTVVTMVARDHTGVVLWAGDSRLYRLRDSHLDQITRDHNPISDLLDSGAVSESEAVNSDTNVITRAVGGQSRLVLDVAVFDIRPDDTYLLCSDGLYREIDQDQICRELANASVTDAVTALMAGGLKGEARDNISMVVARPRAL